VSHHLATRTFLTKGGTVIGPCRTHSAIAALALGLLVTACGPQQEVVDAFEQDGGAAAAPGAAAGSSGGPAAGPGSTGSGTGLLTTGGTSTGAVRTTGPAGSSATTGGTTGSSLTGTSGSVGVGGTTTAGGTTTGAAATGGDRTGVTDTEIRLGYHTAKHISGVDFDRVSKVSEVVRVYWKSVNEDGINGVKGINGRAVTVRVEDDFYDPTAAVNACKTLADDFKAFFISGTGGADQTVACGQYLSKRQIYYGSLGASENGLQNTPYYFGFSATYDDQAPLQARWIVNSLGGKTKSVALVRANSANFNGAHGGFVSAFKAAAGKNLTVDDVVDRNGDAQELATECTKLAAANNGLGVDIVSVLASPTVFARMAQACQAQGYEPQFTGWGNTAACNPDPGSLGTPALDGCLTFSNFHSPWTITTKPGGICRAAWDKYASDDFGAYPPGSDNICGYMDVLREAFTRSGRNLTRERFAATLRAMKYDNGLLNPIDFKGGQYAADKVVIWRGDASCSCMREVERRWRNDF
jgi:branched-chain amino acid transport system substrate-binding protein